MNDVEAQWRHDCRTPIHQILGYSELLVEDAQSEGNAARVRDLGRIRSAALALLDRVSAPSAVRRAGASPDPHVVLGTVPVGVGSASVPPETRRPLSGRVLVVDDDSGNCELLVRRLEREGLEVEAVMEGVAALRRASEGGFDLILLDVLMPGMDGREVLMGLKASDRTRHIPVLMVSALDEFTSVVTCIEAGAEDYLPKPVEPALLRARIGSCLERKHLRDLEQEHLRRIEETQSRLEGELAEAARYVRSILPDPLSGFPSVDWLYRPCSELGGDAFGYHWLDEERMAIYLLDVCGHGVGASLLSVAAPPMTSRWCGWISGGEAMKNEHTVRFRADLDSLAGVDVEVQRWLDQSSAPPSCIHWVRLVIEELATNTIKYGGGEVDTVRIEVTIRRETWGTAIEYRDDGLAFDPFSVPPYDLDLPVEQRPIGGLGVYLIRKMSDHVAYGRKEGWNRLRLEKLTKGSKECPKLSVE